MKRKRAKTPTLFKSRAWLWLRDNAWSLFPYVLFAGIVLPAADYVTLFDGSAYMECVRDAVVSGFTLANFQCYKHSMIFFAFPYAIVMWLSQGNVYAINALTFALFAASIFAFQKIIAYIFPSESKLNRGLMAALFATHPTLLAITLNYTPDSGLVYFSVFLFAALLYRRYALALLAGLFLVFSKEMGVMLHILIVSVWALFCIVRAKRPWPWRLNEMYRIVPLVFPVLLFFLYLGFFPKQFGYPAEQAELTAQDAFRLLFQFNAFHPRFLTSLFDIFILNFLWVPSLILLAAGASVLFRFVAGLPARKARMKSQEAVVTLLLAALCVYVLTRYVHTNNLRYFNAAYVFLLLSFCIAVVHLWKNSAWRTSVLSIVLLLQVVSVFNSADPVSRHLAGTFMFGERPIFSLGTMSGEEWCCGYGTNQQFYSPEFMFAFYRMQNMAYEWIKPTADTVILQDSRAIPPVVERIDGVTHRRVLFSDHEVVPKYGHVYTSGLLAPTPPPEVFFIHYPNYNSTEEFAVLLKQYVIAEKKTLTWAGYALDVSRLTLRLP